MLYSLQLGNVTVGFNPTSYSVFESDGSVSVFLFITGSRDIPIVITMATIAVNALGI